MTCQYVVGSRMIGARRLCWRCIGDGHVRVSVRNEVLNVHAGMFALKVAISSFGYECDGFGVLRFGFEVPGFYVVMALTCHINLPRIYALTMSPSYIWRNWITLTGHTCRPEFERFLKEAEAEKEVPVSLPKITCQASN